MSTRSITNEQLEDRITTVHLRVEGIVRAQFGYYEGDVLLQNVWMRVLNNSEGFEGADDPAAYVMRAVRHEHLDRTKAREARERAHRDVKQLQSARQHHSQEPRSLVRAYLEGLRRHRENTLPSQVRKAFEMSVLEQLPTAKIQRLLRLKKSSVLKYIQRYARFVRSMITKDKTI